MALIRFYACVAAVLWATTCALNAQILSGSFEEASNLLWKPNGPWDVNGQIPEILTTFTAEDRNNNEVTIDAVDGNNFILLSTGGGTPEASYSQISQVIDVNAGDSISGVYFFSTTDWMPQWNDSGMVYLSTPEPNTTTGEYDVEILLAYSDVNSVVIFGGSPGGSMASWGRFVYTIAPEEAGTYRLVIRVADSIDYAYPSRLAVDTLQITPGPPGPWCDYKLVGDINHDCKVDLADFAMMSENWLIDCNLDPGDPACISPYPQ